MFTQKHYQVLADVIYQARKKSADLPDWDEYVIRTQTLADLTADLIKVFKQDNPKFNQFLFIGAACKDLAAKE
jgi:hypothetical protein